MKTRIVAGFVMIALAGCGGSDSVAPGPTPTATPVPAPTPAAGPQIVFMGVLRADETLLDASGTDAAGRSIYIRQAGSGFVLVVDAKPGANGAAVATSAFASQPSNPTARPDLQIEVSRDLGDGSPAVCDNTVGNFGGVPGIDPPSFDETQGITNALNDLGCRFNDGTGIPRGRMAVDACVLYPDGEFRFADPSATLEFCGFISRPLAFPDGDTIVTARVLDQNGAPGPEEQIVVRISGF